MESSPQSRSEIGTHVLMILVTVANLILITVLHKYIAWYTTGSDGSVTQLSILTDDYFIWLPVPITASIIVIAASIVMIIYDRNWLRQTAWIIFSLIGIAVVVSLLSIFPFDFSVIPNAAAADVVPTAVTAFLIFMAVVYGVSALVLFVRLIRRYAVKQEA